MYHLYPKSYPNWSRHSFGHLSCSVTPSRTCHQVVPAHTVHLDPSFEAISLPPPAPAHLFWVQHVMQPHTNPQDAFTAMADFVSGWFEYPPLPAKRSKDVSSWYEVERIQRYVSTADRPIRPSTRVAEIGDPTFRACNEPGAASSDITIMTPVYTGEFRSVTDAVLFEDPETVFWTGMRVEYIYCVNSFWPCVYAGEAVRCRFEEAVRGRKVKAIPEANHFVSVIRGVSRIGALLMLAIYVVALDGTGSLSRRDHLITLGTELRSLIASVSFCYDGLSRSNTL